MSRRPPLPTVKKLLGAIYVSRHGLARAGLTALQVDELLAAAPEDRRFRSIRMADGFNYPLRALLVALHCGEPTEALVRAALAHILGTEPTADLVRQVLQPDRAANTDTVTGRIAPERERLRPNAA